MCTCCRNSTKGLPRYCLPHRLHAWSPTYVPSSLSASSPACMPCHLFAVPLSISVRSASTSHRHPSSSRCQAQATTSQKLPPYTAAYPRAIAPSPQESAASPPAPELRVAAWHSSYPKPDPSIAHMAPPPIPDRVAQAIPHARPAYEADAPTVERSLATRPVAEAPSTVPPVFCRCTRPHRRTRTSRRTRQQLRAALDGTPA